MKSQDFCVPIWLSNWTFKDARNKIYKANDVIVKGYSKGTIFTDQNVVNKVVKKIIGNKSKHTLKPINLELVSQHGYGIKE